MKALQIKDFSDYYVTDIGEVFSYKKRIKRLKPQVNIKGYLTISLCKNGKIYKKMIHRLVAETFILNSENKQQVNHKDGNKTNNYVSNLEWVTGSENILHSYKKLGRVSTFKGKYGIKHSRAKIIQQIYNNKIINTFYGAREAERETGVCCSNIIACCKNKLKKAGNYQWKYKKI